MPARTSSPSDWIPRDTEQAQRTALSWTVEGGEKPIAGCLDLATTKPSQFAANQHVVAIEKVPPPTVAERRRFFCRANDVGEEHCGENAVGLDGVTDAR